MPRYIDADKFNKFNYESDRGVEFDSPREAYIQGIEYVLSEIDEVPTADVHEVVRCKDCVYFAEDMKCPYCDYWESVTCKDDFCSNGIQMDGDEK